MKDDLAFLSNQYVDYEVPKDKRYLLKYFRTPVQRDFLKYYFVFGNFDHFIDHTGHACQKRWLKLLFKKMQKIELMRNKAKQDFDLEQLAKIESGKLKLCGI